MIDEDELCLDEEKQMSFAESHLVHVHDVEGERREILGLAEEDKVATTGQLETGQLETAVVETGVVETGADLVDSQAKAT